MFWRNIWFGWALKHPRGPDSVSLKMEVVCFSKPFELSTTAQCRNPKEDKQFINTCHENLENKIYLYLM
jgi:hypothetical protein